EDERLAVGADDDLGAVATVIDALDRVGECVAVVHVGLVQHEGDLDRRTVVEVQDVVRHEYAGSPLCNRALGAVARHAGVDEFVDLFFVVRRTPLAGLGLNGSLRPSHQRPQALRLGGGERRARESGVDRHGTTTGRRADLSCFSGGSTTGDASNTRRSGLPTATSTSDRDKSCPALPIAYQPKPASQHRSCVTLRTRGMSEPSRTAMYACRPSDPGNVCPVSSRRKPVVVDGRTRRGAGAIPGTAATNAGQNPPAASTRCRISGGINLVS